MSLRRRQKADTPAPTPAAGIPSRGGRDPRPGAAAKAAPQGELQTLAAIPARRRGGLHWHDQDFAPARA